MGVDASLSQLPTFDGNPLLPRLASGRKILQRTLRVRGAWLGLLVLLLLVVMALTADVLSPYAPLRQDYKAVLQPPGPAHLLGTDALGRDVLSRIIHGSRVSLEVGLVCVSLAIMGGIAIGLMTGYWGGRVDDVVMRIIDAVYAFPVLILALAITAALGPGLVNAMIAITVVYIPTFARLVRGDSLSVREREFVQAAKVLGAGDLWIMWRHILPNVTAPIIVQGSLSVGFAIIVESSLSFLGVGVRPPTPTWGSILYEGYQYLEMAPWLSLFPGTAIFVTVLGLNLLGDGLRAALDPKLRERGEA